MADCYFVHCNVTKGDMAMLRIVLKIKYGTPPTLLTSNLTFIVCNVNSSHWLCDTNSRCWVGIAQHCSEVFQAFRIIIIYGGDINNLSNTTSGKGDNGCHSSVVFRICRMDREC